MTVDAEATRSRRALLYGAIGAAAGAVAAIVGRAQPASAASGDAIIIGKNDNEANSSLTELYASSTWGIRVWNRNAGYGVWGHGNNGTGVRGSSNDTVGVHGTAVRDEGIGVFGEVDGGTGVKGLSERGVGVWGVSEEAAGVRGVSTSGVGVRGVSNAGTGVYGQSGSGDEFEAGVIAEGNATGLFAFAGARGILAFSNGIAVEGASDSTGVVGRTRLSLGNSIGVHAISEQSGGVALKVRGKATFNRSGLKEVPTGAKAVVVAVPGGLGANAKVLCTLESDVSGLAIGRIQKTPAGSFTVFLNKVVPVERFAKVAWFVLG
jgi:hypothetical protein